MSHEVTRTSYEWDLESIDEYGDITDHDWCNKCPGIPPDQKTRLVLIRDVYQGLAAEFNESATLRHRAWAYVVDGKLPEKFDDGHPIPKRFHKELEKVQ